MVRFRDSRMRDRLVLGLDELTGARDRSRDSEVLVLSLVLGLLGIDF